MTSYRQHVDRLVESYGSALERCGYDTLLIHSGRALAKSRFDDQDWPLRPTPSFAHWLPLAEADCVLEVRAGDTPRLYRAVHDSFWEGTATPPPADMLERFDIVETDATKIADAAGAAGKRAAFIGDDSSTGEKLGVPADAINPSELLEALDQVRAHKSAYEIECMAAASARAIRGHKKAQQAFAAGPCSELDLHLLYLGETEQDDADAPYKNIFAIGRNAAVLHHVHYGRDRVQGPTSLLVDAGATHAGYASDITRTVVRGDTGAARDFGALIAAVDSMQQKLVGELRVGLSFEALHDRTHELLADVLIDCGLATGSATDLVELGATRALFPHGLGHSLGVQVHDVGCKLVQPAERNPFLRNTAAVEVGHVVTIEPGCYFIDALLEPLRGAAAGQALDWSKIDALRPFGGIRIEDNVAVTEAGVRNLTREHW